MESNICSILLGTLRNYSVKDRQRSYLAHALVLQAKHLPVVRKVQISMKKHKFGTFSSREQKNLYTFFPEDSSWMKIVSSYSFLLFLWHDLLCSKFDPAFVSLWLILTFLIISQKCQILNAYNYQNMINHKGTWKRGFLLVISYKLMRWKVCHMKQIQLSNSVLASWSISK